MALGAKQRLPSSSKTLGPEGSTDWGRDEDCDPADVPGLAMILHWSCALECYLASRKECNSIPNTHIFSFYYPVSIFH